MPQNNQSLINFRDLGRFPGGFRTDEELNMELQRLHNALAKIQYYFPPYVDFAPAIPFGAQVAGGVGNGILINQYQIRGVNNCTWKGALTVGGTTFMGGGPGPLNFTPPFASVFNGTASGTMIAKVAGVFIGGECAMIGVGATLNFYFDTGVIPTGVAPAWAAGDFITFAIDYMITPPLA